MFIPIISNSSIIVFRFMLLFVLCRVVFFIASNVSLGVLHQATIILLLYKKVSNISLFLSFAATVAVFGKNNEILKPFFNFICKKVSNILLFLSYATTIVMFGENNKILKPFFILFPAW